MKEEKKWDYDFCSQRNSVFEKQETIGKEQWEREEMQQMKSKKEFAAFGNWKNMHSDR